MVKFSPGDPKRRIFHRNDVFRCSQWDNACVRI